MPDDRVQGVVAPEYTEEEQERVISYLFALKKVQIRTFFEDNRIAPRWGTKAQLRAVLGESLEDGSVAYETIVEFLDEVEPFGKQHVFLYDGPEERVERWRDAEWVETHLDEHEVGDLLNAHLPLMLPQDLQLSSIEYNEARLRLFSVERRDFWARIDELDRVVTTEHGEDIELRAYRHDVSRGLVIFEWNLVANSAELRISQLPSGSRYELVQERFSNLVAPWLDLTRFQMVDIKRAIPKLHRAEERGDPEARSHGIDYRSPGGRQVSGRSPTPRDSLLGERVIDDAMRDVREHGIGHLGNFYWLPADRFPREGNPLQQEIHVILIAGKGRINFPTPNAEDDLKHVLSRVRTLSQ